MARLTYKQKKNLPDSAFALKSKRKYVITDRKHARDALSRASHNETKRTQLYIARKVHRKFPDIHVAILGKK